MEWHGTSRCFFYGRLRVVKQQSNPARCGSPNLKRPPRYAMEWNDFVLAQHPRESKGRYYRTVYRGKTV